MSVDSITPDLMVEDIETTVEWYERVFDAEVAATLPNDAETDYFWAQVMLDGCPLMFQERESLETKLPVLEDVPVGGSVPLYIDIEDTEKRHAELEAAGAEIVKPPHETEFGWRQFAATDCNGYVLWFGEKLDREQAENIGQYERTYHRHPVDESAGHRSVEHRSPDTTENDHWG
jgi:uncharacterized glyoxalase superfamily protein PhnB